MSLSTDNRSHIHQKVHELLELGDVQEALRISRQKTASDPASKNLLGVCLMRNGQADEAVRLYRQLVVTSGGYVMRPDAPVTYKTNFATALLLNGQVHGAEEVLHEIGDESHPSVKRLREDIQAFRGKLSLLRRILWRCGLEPDAPVPLTEPIGDLS